MLLLYRYVVNILLLTNYFCLIQLPCLIYIFPDAVCPQHVAVQSKFCFFTIPTFGWNIGLEDGSGSEGF